MVPKSMVFTFRRYLASRSRDKARSVIKTFELQPKLHNQYSPVSQYVKALVKVGKLDEKDFLRNLLKANSNPNAKRSDGDWFLRFLRFLVRIIDSFEVGILPGVKHLLEEAIETTDPKLKYILAVCVVPCILVYMSRSFNIVEKISDKDKYHQNSSIKLRDLKGLDDAKAELRETVDYLNHPEHFRGLGGNYSVGVLLVGPPGTDKTTLARAVAGEAKVHFFSFSGGEYKEAGVEKIKNVFAAAKQMKACVIIFDEIEALGQNERIKERLLLELEGFKEHKETNLIMIGATDQPNLVDQSLLKHGRFDRHVFVSYPDIHGRLQILDSHLLKVPKADDVDVMIIARATLGFSSADLANLVNVAAVRAARDGSTDVSMHHLEYARDQIMMGSECKFALTSEESRKTTAFREGGHALVAMHTYGALPVHKATIVPGMVSQLPDKDQTSHSRKQMLARLDVCMGGRVAEELIFGESGVTSGASSDLSHATSLAREMVTQYGMSTEVGLVTHNYCDNGRNMSSETRLLIEKEVKNLLDRAYNNAKTILTTHEKELDALANALLEHETLTGSQIKDLLAKSHAVEEASSWFGPVKKLLQWL